MSGKIERIVTVEQSTVMARAINSQYENLLELGAETAKRRSCIDCTHIALCGIAINTLRARKSGSRIDSMGKIDTHGVKIDQESESICPGGLVDEALRRNQSNDFWLLDADELNDANLEVRAAQTVLSAAEHVRQVVSNKIIT